VMRPRSPSRGGDATEIESAAIQLAQCLFAGLAISNAEILIYFQIKYTEAILSNNTRKLLWFEITRMLKAV